MADCELTLEPISYSSLFKIMLFEMHDMLLLVTFERNVREIELQNGMPE